MDKPATKRFIVKTHANGDVLGDFDTRVEADEALQKILPHHSAAFVGDTGVVVPPNLSDAERGEFLKNAKDDKKTASEIAVDEAVEKEAEARRKEALSAISQDPKK